MYDFWWPGTYEGCDCRGIYFSYYEGVRINTFSAGGCSWNETMAGCYEVYA